MESTLKTEAPGNRLFVLALGLLVGFAFGFVMLLARLPVGSVSSNFGTNGIHTEPNNYQFYSLLEEQTLKLQPRVTRRDPAPVAKNIIPPATRVVPGNVQSLSARNLAAESYAEIPASSMGQESYYLQAGNFIQPDDAQQARAVVLLLGLEAFIVVRKESNGATGHRVRIGPFFDKAKITTAKKRLQKGGISYKLIRVTG